MAGAAVSRVGVLAVAAVAGLAMPVGADLAAQDPDAAPGIRFVEATPVGALPPMALPMPASRNNNYWTFRVQAGNRTGRDGPDLFTVAGGVDLQWRGGSIFGLTGGYRMPDCDGEGCDARALLGARGRFNFLTGGPTVAGVFGDYSATTTLGAEIGFGWAEDAAPDGPACTFDFGVPLSVGMLQTVRLVTFVMPSIAWDVDCGGGPGSGSSDYILSAGIGVQQLLLDGLDVYLGFQNVLHGGTGHLFGLSVSYVLLP